MKKKSHRPSVLFTSISIALFLVGCVSQIDKISYGNFESLQTFHLAFIDEFTEGENKSWDAEAFTQRVQTGTEKFSEALAYETGKNNSDPTRLKALNILVDQFKSDSELIKDKGGLLNKYFSGQLKTQVEENYNLALEGELSRDK